MAEITDILEEKAKRHLEGLKKNFSVFYSEQYSSLADLCPRDIPEQEIKLRLSENIAMMAIDQIDPGQGPLFLLDVLYGFSRDTVRHIFSSMERKEIRGFSKTIKMATRVQNDDLIKHIEALEKQYSGE